MALTEAQRSQIRAALGWSARFARNSNESGQLERAMDAIGAWPTDEAVVTDTLTALADIDTRLTDALNRLKASNVGSIALNPAEVMQLRSEGRRLARVISGILGVAMKGGKYGGSGATGGPILEG